MTGWRRELLEQFEAALRAGELRVAPGLPYEDGGQGLTLVEQLPLADRLGSLARPDVLDRWAAQELLCPAGSNAVLHPEPVAAVPGPAGLVLNGTITLPGPPPEWVLLWPADTDVVVRVAAGAELVARPVLGLLLYELPLAGRVVSPGDEVADGAAFATAVTRAQVRQAAYLLALAAQSLRVAAGQAERRMQFGRPIGDFQAVGHRIAAQAVRVRGARLVVARVAEAVDAGSPDARPAQAVRTASELARACAATAVHVSGAAGLVGDAEAAQLYRRAAVDGGRLGEPVPPGRARRSRRQPPEWTCDPEPYEPGEPVHRLVDRRAAEFPDATAVVFGDHQLSYRELDRQVAALTARLRLAGARPGDVIGVLLSRSPDLVVAVLAVLRVGAACLPLNLDYPPDRIAATVADAAPRLVVTHEWSTGPVGGRAPVLTVDVTYDTAPPGPPAVLHPRDVAYVTYTSGSTGAPKGVATEHRGLANRFAWEQRRFPLGPSDTVLLHASPAFDVAMWEMLAPLAAGAQLAIAPPAVDGRPGLLAAVLRRHQVTVFTLVPSLLEMLLDEPGGLAECPRLRRVFCGGEPLSAGLRRRAAAATGAELHNMYGPTEASIDATHWACDPADPSPVSPIGRPLSNVEVHVLDERMRPVPAGLRGELYVGGPGLARGYLRRPGLTAEQFVPNPYGRSARLYRTGDLARFRADGTLEFLGRTDNQVKVRGHRIELGEVEATLEAQPEVHRAVVVAAEGGTRLWAYVVPAAGAWPDPAELLEQLRRRLPGAAVPAGVTLLPALPLTPNGKLDRRALGTRATAPAAGTAPVANSPEQQEVLRLFQSVLTIDPPALDDDFFRLGGNSLLATRLLAGIRRSSGTQVELGAFLADPTPRGLAALLTANPDR